MSMVNLLPEDYVIRRRQRRTNTICLVLFVIVMTAVLGVAVITQRKCKHALAIRDEVNAEYAEAAQLIDQMQQLERQQTSMLHKAQNAGALMERVPRSYLLAMITQCMPEGASLVRVKLTTEEVKPAGGQPGAKRSAKFKAKQAAAGGGPATQVVMQVTGRAGTDVQVARLIANLAKNPLVDMVDLVYSEEKEVTAEKIAVREFQILLELKPTADVIDVLGQPDNEEGAPPSTAQADEEQGAAS